MGGNLIGVAFWFLVADVLAHSNFGELAFFLGIASITATVSLLGYDNGLVVLIGKKFLSFHRLLYLQYYEKTRYPNPLYCLSII